MTVLRWRGAEGDDPSLVDEVEAPRMDANYTMRHGLTTTRALATAPGPLAPLGGATPQRQPRTSSQGYNVYLTVERPSEQLEGTAT